MHDPKLQEKTQSGRPLSEAELLRYVEMEIKRQSVTKENEPDENGDRIYTLLWCERNETKGQSRRVRASSSQDALSSEGTNPLGNVMAFPVILPESLTWREAESI